MGERVFKQHDKEPPSSQSSDEESASNKSDNAIRVDLDSILDQIDEVLEDNAEEFVKSYVQKGGQ